MSVKFGDRNIPVTRYTCIPRRLQDDLSFVLMEIWDALINCYFLEPSQRRGHVSRKARYDAYWKALHNYSHRVLNYRKQIK